MHILVLVVASTVLLTGVIYNSLTGGFNVSKKESNVLSLAGENEKDYESTSQPTLAELPSNGIVITPTVYPKTSLDIKFFIYPGAETISASPDTISLKSSDSADLITEWYKDRIRVSGMNVKTFVSTKANNKVENVLVGSDSEKTIRIEINKEPSDEDTSVIVRETLN